MWLQLLNHFVFAVAHAQVGEVPSDPPGQVETQTIMTLVAANLPIIIAVVAVGFVSLLAVLMRGSTKRTNRS